MFFKLSVDSRFKFSLIRVYYSFKIMWIWCANIFFKIFISMIMNEIGL